MEKHLEDEEGLLAAARKGDRAAFGVLVRAHQRRAYAAAYGIVGNREDALELAQEAFARAFRAMGRFKPGMPFYPWLYQIVRNTCLNHLKRRRRRGEQSLEDLVESGFDARDPSPGPGEAAERNDLRESIAAAMSRLSPEHREILRLRHFMELSYSEIAACLRVPEGTVMSRLHAARKSLRRVLEQQDRSAANISAAPV